MADQGSMPTSPRASSPGTPRRLSTDVQASTGSQTPRRAVVDVPRLRPSVLQRTRTHERTRSPSSLDVSSARSDRKPLPPRRLSSRMVPHRGESFSTYDASQEVEEEELQKISLRRTHSNTLRTTPSTVRRRPNAKVPSPLLEMEHAEDMEQQASSGAPTAPEELLMQMAEEDTAPDDSDDIVEDEEDDPDEADLSDTESFTLKDRQEAINDTHPFGIRLWKAALYKKNRSIEKGAEGDIHSAPGGKISPWLLFFNLAWTVLFGWWLALFAMVGALVCLILGFAPGCQEYGHVFWGLSRYLLYPFGKYVKLIQDEAYAQEDQGEGRTVRDYEQWQSGDLEQGRLFFGPANLNLSRDSPASHPQSRTEAAPLLGSSHGSDSESNGKGNSKRRLFGRGQWNTGRVVFFMLFWCFLQPLLLLVSALCWLAIFSIPMARVGFLLCDHLRRHPLALEFLTASSHTHVPGAAHSSILLCTYRAVGVKYWRYTIDGTNIILFNLLALVGFVIFDYYVLYVAFGLRIGLTNTVFIFLLALLSITPLAYFIGQAVASVSAQSTMGVGAVVNAFFSTVVEVFLYCVALRQGKAQLVEGSVIGSIFAGILLLPGISMCFGALKRKTQRFNVKSAGVTSTMLLFAVIAAFGPTLLYQIYGSHEVNCDDCSGDAGNPLDRDCRRCYFAQIPAMNDPFYQRAVRPYTWFAAVLLFLAYVVGLFFTLRTHAATIWNAELDEKKPDKTMTNMANSISTLPGTVPKIATTDYGALGGSVRGTLSRQNTKTDIRDSQLYKRILGQSLKQAGLPASGQEASEVKKAAYIDGAALNDETTQTAQMTSATAEPSITKRAPSLRLRNLTDDDNQRLIRQIAEMAATAATVAARDASMAPRKTSAMSRTTTLTNPNPTQPESHRTSSVVGAPTLDAEETVATGVAEAGGHDAPNWSRTKSYIVLLTATLAYAVIAEILVDTVDVVLSNSDIDEKFLGITLFALVPNTTEFLNGISFAMNGNIALSLEIGSAYALQVCLLQIPALVLFSAVTGRFVDPKQLINHTFTLIFPQWDMVTVILCVFLLSYMYGEGKSNYFKGSILILSYLVVVMGFYMAGFNTVDVLDPNDPPNGMGIGMNGRSYSTRYRTMGAANQVIMGS